MVVIDRLFGFLYRKTDEYKHKLHLQRLVRDGLTIGEKSYIGNPAEIYYPQNVSIGKKVHINDHVLMLAEYGKISIGNNVTLSSHSKLIAGTYNLEHWVQTSERLHIENSDVTIGDYVWICAGATILTGVSITGKYVVVGAGAVVTHDITEDYAVVAGVPAQIVKRLR